MLQDMLDEYQKLPDGQVKTDRLADIAAIQRALEVPGSHLIYLEKPGDPSQMAPAATSVGRPVHRRPRIGDGARGVRRDPRDDRRNDGRGRQLRNEAMNIAAETKMDGSHSIATIAWVRHRRTPAHHRVVRAFLRVADFGYCHA